MGVCLDINFVLHETAQVVKSKGSHPGKYTSR